jgi:hypothetical protein
MGLITVIFQETCQKRGAMYIYVSSMTYVLAWRYACRVYMVMYVSHYGGNGGNNNTNCQNCAQLEET